MPLGKTLGRGALVALGLTVGAVLATTSPAPAYAPVGVPAPAGAPGVTGPAAVPADLTATIALSNCSASLVRFPDSVDTDRAMMLTNGHCYEGGMPSAGEVLVDRPSSQSGSLLDAGGDTVGTVHADRLLYATMTGTDVSLYRLTQTIGAIKSSTGISPLTIAGSHPSAGSTFLPSGYFRRVFPCNLAAFVPTLREDQWTWHDSLKYDHSCQVIHGTSGSPVVSTVTGEIVGINNTNNDDGQQCTLNNPCEVNADGTITVIQGQGYGQETYWIVTCETPARTFDLDQPGCLLEGGGGGGGPTQVTVTNPGDQTGTVDVPTSLTLTANGTTGATTWTANGLPAGLTINTTSGTISGTPTTAGSYTVTATATSNGQSGSTTFTWTINPASGPGGGCSGAATWSATQAYSPGDQVSYDGHLWKSTWWSTGAEPGSPGAWAVWSDAGTC